MMPMKLFTLSLVPGQVQHDEDTRYAEGTLNMMTSGSMSDLNWLARTMYTRPAP